MEFNAQKRNSKWDREHGNYLFTNEGDTTKGVLKLQTQYATVTDPGDAGTITPPADTPVFICNVTSAGASETRVLGAPDHYGQRAIIRHAVDGGDFAMTNASGWQGGGASNDVATFAEAEDLMIVEAAGLDAVDWREVVNVGVAFA